MSRNGTLTIKTTGDLRKFLAESITKVSSGEMGVDEANRVIKLASQINESIYSEVKVAKTKWEMGETAKIDLGKLSID